MDLQEVRSLFPGLDHTVYMNTAALAIGCTPACEAYKHAISQWSEGKFDWMEAENAGEEARALFASIINADVQEIAIIPAVSTAAGIVSAQLDPVKSGENILVAENEFSSNYYSWLLLKEKGYDLRVVPSEDGIVPADSYAKYADPGTRLIAVSAVQSSNGYQVDLAALSEIAKRYNAWLFVDACQAAGAIHLDVQKIEIDFLATASHKFLLGARGMGYLYVRQELLAELRPILPGWKAAQSPYQSFYGPQMNLSSSASKLDASLQWFAALAERASLRIFKRFGLQSIVQRNTQLMQHLYDRLNEADIDWTPFSPQNRSTVISIPVSDPDTVMRRFEEANVMAAVRAGRVRLSLHFYNSEKEIDLVSSLITGN